MVRGIRGRPLGVKETKPRLLMKGCGRQLFIEAFGKPIEEFDSFKRAIAGNNHNTVKIYRRVLPAYFLFLGENPDVVISNRKSDIASSDALDTERYERKTKIYIKNLVERNLTVSCPLGVIHGFFSNNSRRLSLDLRQLKYPKARKTRKYSPSNEEVRQLISYADCARDKFIVAVMFQSGPAPIDVAALQVGCYPVEPWVYFEFSRSKTGEVWRGVSTPDVCEFLKAYLVIRGGVVGEPLLVGREGSLNSEGVSQVVHTLIVKAGFSSIAGFKPKCLRDGFEDALVDAEIYHKVKEALMGHTVGIEHEYGSYKKMVERLVEAVKKVYPLICLNDVNKIDGSLVGLTKQDVENVREIAKNVGVYREVLGLLKAKRLVDVDDPELVKRLRAEGKIK